MTTKAPVITTDPPVITTEPPVVTNEPTPYEPTPEVPEKSAELVWAVEPHLDFTRILCYKGIVPYDGYLAYTEDDYMYIVDEKTGEILRQTGPTGGIANDTHYYYDEQTGEFFYNLQYDYYREDKSVVDSKSRNMMLTISRCKMEQTEWGGYENTMNYKEMRAAVYYNGNFISDFDYEDAFSGIEVAFLAEYYYQLVSDLPKYAVMNKNGELITDFSYVGGSRIAKGYVAVGKTENSELDEKWGLLDYDGNEIIPFVFESIEGIDEYTVFAKYEGKYGILDVRATAEFLR
jgi:hypothetical protein